LVLYQRADREHQPATVHRVRSAPPTASASPALELRSAGVWIDRGSGHQWNGRAARQAAPLAQTHRRRSSARPPRQPHPV